MQKLYDYWDSGNCYKVRLLLAQLGIEYERIAIDIRREEELEPVVAMNPNRRVPILVTDSGATLFESNAILYYLARGTPYLPDDRLQSATVLHWMFFEQNSHEPNIATLRAWRKTGRARSIDPKVLEFRRELGYFALGVMEKHLEARPFLAGEQYTIADIALYAYTHVAAEGEYDLEPYAAVRAWMRAVAEQPRHIKLTD